MLTTLDEILACLKTVATANHLSEMQRVGINTHQTWGISLYDLRKVAKEIGVNHELALALWQTGIHEARILAGIIADADRVDDALLESWVADFDSWDVCDQVCDIFARSRLGYVKAVEWTERPEEFVKRSAFVIMAHLAVYDRLAPDEKLARFLPIIIRHADDDRNYVKKAVNWALRNIGKRNQNLNRLAIAAAEEIRRQDTRPARWIASDALRELTSEKVQNRFKN